MNGTADGIIIAEMSNWNGKAVKIPRTEIQNNSIPDDLGGAGIYFLFCNEDSVFIGTAENMQERLKQHLKDIFHWHTVIAFTSKSLNKKLLHYLESMLVNDAETIGRYKVLTQAGNYDTNLKESQIAAMSEFIGNIKLILGATNYGVFIPKPKTEGETQYLYCRRESSGTNAKGFRSAGGFTVMKGSVISDHVTPSMKDTNYYVKRLELIADGIISGNVFQIDYEFTSPSAASTVVLGHTSNGNADWKTEDGTALGNI